MRIYYFLHIIINFVDIVDKKRLKPLFMQFSKVYIQVYKGLQISTKTLNRHKLQELNAFFFAILLNAFAVTVYKSVLAVVPIP